MPVASSRHVMPEHLSKDSVDSLRLPIRFRVVSRGHTMLGTKSVDEGFQESLQPCS